MLSEEKIKELMKEISNLKYKEDNYSFEFNVISGGKENLTKLENVIRKFLLDNQDAEIGELKAKVYAYEKIIANSNFAPILGNKSKGEKKDAK